MYITNGTVFWKACSSRKESCAAPGGKGQILKVFFSG